MTHNIKYLKRISKSTNTKALAEEIKRQYKEAEADYCKYRNHEDSYYRNLGIEAQGILIALEDVWNFLDLPLSELIYNHEESETDIFLDPEILIEEIEQLPESTQLDFIDYMSGIEEF